MWRRNQSNRAQYLTRWTNTGERPASRSGKLYIEFALGEVAPESREELLVVDRAVQDGGFGFSVRLIRKGLCVKFSVSASSAD